MLKLWCSELELPIVFATLLSYILTDIYIGSVDSTVHLRRTIAWDRFQLKLMLEKNSNKSNVFRHMVSCISRIIFSPQFVQSSYINISSNIIAKVAFELIFPATLFMRIRCIFMFKFLETNRTTEFQLSSMNIHVCLEMILALEIFTTNLAASISVWLYLDIFFIKSFFDCIEAHVVTNSEATKSPTINMNQHVWEWL